MSRKAASILTILRGSGTWAAPSRITGSANALRRSRSRISRQHMGAIEAPNMVRATSLEVVFNIATVLGVEPYVLFKFNPEK